MGGFYDEFALSTRLGLGLALERNTYTALQIHHWNGLSWSIERAENERNLDHTAGLLFHRGLKDTSLTHL